MLFLMKKEEFLARKYGNWPVFQKAHSGSSLGDWLKNIQGQAFWDIKTAFQEKDSEDLKWIGGSKEDFWEMDWQDFMSVIIERGEIRDNSVKELVKTGEQSAAFQR